MLLSDFHAFKDREALRKIFLRRKVHAFQLLSPIELYQKGPFLIHSKEGSFEERGGERILFSQKKHHQAFFGKNVKRLDVEKRYLDNFVKEMM